MALLNDIRALDKDAVSELAFDAGPVPAVKPIDIGRVTRLINRIRARHDADAVVFDKQLAALAMEHCLMMASNGRVTNSFGPGTGLRSRLAAAGLRGVGAESVGAGHSTVDSLFQDWSHRRGHRENIVHARMTHFGFAAATNPLSRYRAYWTLILFRPSSGYLHTDPIAQSDSTV